jgi:Domain of unknown function (DUF6265)
MLTIVRMAVMLGAPALASLTAPVQAQVPASPQSASLPVIASGKRTVGGLAWMTGCWQTKSTRDGSTSNEIWLAARGGSMSGIGQTYGDNTSLSWEAMRIYEEGASVKLWLRPGHRKEQTLTLGAAGDGFAAFSAAEADTTTTLRYERKSPTEMAATFRREQGENRRGADYLFTKVDCAEIFAPVARDVVAK